jgi:hypothetical protein
MPLEPAFAESLKGKVLTISLQGGWGWKARTSDGGEEWRSYQTPDAQLRVRDVALVQRGSDVLGFTGAVEAGGSEFRGLCILALTHTTDAVNGDDVIPLAIAFSPTTPECTPDATKPAGYRPAPQGSPAYLGFGILVPADIEDKVSA